MTEQDMKNILDKLVQLKYEPSASLFERFHYRLATVYTDEHVAPEMVSLVEIGLLWTTLDKLHPENKMFNELMSIFTKKKDEK